VVGGVLPQVVESSHISAQNSESFRVDGAKQAQFSDASGIHDPSDHATRQRWRVSIQEFFQVAIDHEDRAVEAVRTTAKVVNGTPVEVVGELSSTEIGWLSLGPGEVRSVRRTIAGSERRDRRARR
jgi:hypothetical protein